jgi:hypothetical protein
MLCWMAPRLGAGVRIGVRALFYVGVILEMLADIALW